MFPGGAFESRFHILIGANLIFPDLAISRKLNIPITEQVYEVVRHMSRNDEVIGIDYSYIPLYLVPDGIVPDFEKLNAMYLHEFISELFEIKIKNIHIHIDAKLPDNYEKNILRVREDYTLAIWDTLVLGEDRNTVAYTTTVADPKKYRAFINFDLENNPGASHIQE